MEEQEETAGLPQAMNRAAEAAERPAAAETEEFVFLFTENLKILEQ